MIQIHVDQNKSAMFTYLSRSRQAERRDSDQSVPSDRGRGRLVVEFGREIYSLEDSARSPPIRAMHASGARGFLARTAGQAAFDAHHGTGDLVTDACFATGCGVGGPGARSPSGAGAPTKTALPRWAGSSGGGGSGPGWASEPLHQTRLGPGSVTMSAGLDWVPRGGGGGGASVESENHIVCWSLDVMRNWLWRRGIILECLFGR